MEDKIVIFAIRWGRKPPEGNSRGVGQFLGGYKQRIVLERKKEKDICRITYKLCAERKNERSFQACLLKERDSGKEPRTERPRDQGPQSKPGLAMPRGKGRGSSLMSRKGGGHGAEVGGDL